MGICTRDYFAVQMYIIFYSIIFCFLIFYCIQINIFYVTGQSFKSFILCYALQYFFFIIINTLITIINSLKKMFNISFSFKYSRQQIQKQHRMLTIIIMRQVSIVFSKHKLYLFIQVCNSTKHKRVSSPSFLIIIFFIILIDFGIAPKEVPRTLFWEVYLVHRSL